MEIVNTGSYWLARCRRAADAPLVAKMAKIATFRQPENPKRSLTPPPQFSGCPYFV
ncbi:hypothetical protein [Kingella sp. (in: b-proteobacteria)]|uniref:hypothetical protein n=1 Tax=Kingella sp. (in: b-proteobacteria) TaxID=2020713 RepID=UPI0026DC39D0|nr:hypothetical protein [Kingella sp. (in: b-proteobacteria)]MDO4656506.1 hypothetical protein [Kingella sp. (in: b-proteobacteria)]